MVNKIANITHIVCDYNGTIAKDGVVLPQIKSLFEKLSAHYTLHVITADTHGSVAIELADFQATLKILTSLDHTKEKSDYITALGSDQTAAMGNGNNDKEMLSCAALGIAILGDEGCSKETLFAADIICKSAVEALELFLEPKRLVATLRR